MDARKIAVLVLAGLAGLGAFFIAMNSGDDEPVEIVRQVEKAGVRILVSDANLRRGDRLSAAALKWVEWPEEAVALSPQYLREGAVEPADLERAVARTSIVAGEPILEAKIVRAGSRGMMAAVLEAGKRAVTVRVTAETAELGRRPRRPLLH